MSNFSFATFTAKKSQVLEVSQNLSNLATDLGADLLQERLQTSVIKKLTDDNFNLIILGEWNHGKTTLLNALLGKNVLPVSPTPTTSAIHRIVYSAEPNAKVVESNGQEHSINFDDLVNFTAFKNPHEDVVLEVGYPSPLLADRLVIIDTPGVNDLSLSRAEITYDYIPSCDAVVMCLDANQVLKNSERIFLTDKVIGQAREKIIFVVTKIDTLSTEEQDEVMSYTRSQLKVMLNGEEPTVFAVSAAKHLAGQTDVSGIDTFVLYLNAFLADQRGKIILNNALGTALNVCSMVQKGIDTKFRALTMPTDELDRKISAVESNLSEIGSTVAERQRKVREEIYAVRTWARRDLDLFVEEAVKGAKVEVERSKPNDLKVYFNSYLEKQFKDWAEKETKDIGIALESIAEKTIALIKQDANKASSKLFAEFNKTCMPGFKIDVDTFGYDLLVYTGLSIGSIALVVGSLYFAGFMLAAAVPALAYLAKNRTDSEYKRLCLEKLPGLIRSSADKIGPKLDEMIDDFANKLDQFIKEASEDLHKELLDVLKSVKQLQNGTKEEIEKQKVGVVLLGDQILGLEQQLKDLKSSLV